MNKKQPNCQECMYSEILVEEGDSFTTTNPHGFTVEKLHTNTIFLCRHNPPLGDVWSQVSADDWCSKYAAYEEVYKRV